MELKSGIEPPTSPLPRVCSTPELLEHYVLERVAGIEPASSAWKAEVIATIPYPPCCRMVVRGGFEPPKLARQIYSLIPLATREPHHLFDTSLLEWCRHQESNSGPTDYKSVALPTELYRLTTTKWRVYYSVRLRLSTPAHVFFVIFNSDGLFTTTSLILLNKISSIEASNSTLE